MANTTKISVIIPTYNRAGFIESAIDSVLAQNGKWELDIIIVDDGSTDDTKKIIQEYGKKVRYYKLKHSGLPAVARNFGISKAEGDLIAFQDSDDQWPKDKLNQEVSLFENPEVVMVYGQAKVINESGNLTNQNVVSPSKLSNGESFTKLLKENVVSTLTVVVRKQALISVGSFNESQNLRAVEDYELWLRISAKFPRGIKNLNHTLAYYRIHSNNISTANTLQAIERLLNVYDSLWQNPELTSRQRASLENQIAIMQENWSRQQNINGNKPAISVVMGIYKDKSHVKEAARSVLNQTFRDFEFIIIDDGSQDGSYEEVAKINDPRIRIVRQTNHGLVNVLNKGVRLARADFIARQDADDISLPSRFDDELPWISAFPGRGLVGGFFAYINESGKPTGQVITSTTKHIDIVRHMYFDNPIGHGTTIIRRQAILDAGGYRDDYGPNEDFDLWRRIAKNWQIGQIPKVVYKYRLNPMGISNTKSEQQHAFFAKLIQDIWRGPLYKKPIWGILADARYYKRLDSKYSLRVYKQYKSHQVRLSFEFLVHGKLWAGYMNSIGALIIHPTGAIRLWNTWLWAPIKLALGRQVK